LGHGEVEQVVRVDEVVVAVVQLQADPVDGAGQGVVTDRLVGGDGGADVAADVGGHPSRTTRHTDPSTAGQPAAAGDVA
jgi:hypothetical protein